jgi:hypothetical protein
MKSLSQSSAALLFLVSLAIVPVAVQAQSTPASTPPNLEKLEEVPDSGITISKPESNKSKMVEKRVGGKVTEVQVKSGKSKYVVKANPEIGNAPKGTVQGDANRGAQWSVLEFGGKKETKDIEQVPTLPIAPKAAAAASASASMPTKK